VSSLDVPSFSFNFADWSFDDEGHRAAGDPCGVPQLGDALHLDQARCALLRRRAPARRRPSSPQRGEPGLGAAEDAAALALHRDPLAGRATGESASKAPLTAAER